MKPLFFLSMTIFTLFGCGASRNAEMHEHIVSIKHGVSFGHCIGYCTRELFYTDNTIVYTQSSRDEKNYPVKETKQDNDKGGYDELIQSIDWNKWETMPETIGCPDCADGGAEYIEIVTSEGTKRVTFDAGSDPEGLEKTLEILRKNKASFETD